MTREEERRRELEIGKRGRNKRGRERAVEEGRNGGEGQKEEKGRSSERKDGLKGRRW